MGRTFNCTQTEGQDRQQSPKCDKIKGRDERKWGNPLRRFLPILALLRFTVPSSAQSDLVFPHLAVGGSPAYETMLQIINEVEANNPITIDVFQRLLAGSTNGRLLGGIPAGMVVFNGTSAGQESTVGADGKSKAITGKVTAIGADGQTVSINDFSAFHKFGDPPQTWDRRRFLCIADI
jgi:hypothetical protein